VVKRPASPAAPAEGRLLGPDRLKGLWEQVENGLISVEQFEEREGRLLQAYRSRWERALLLEGQSDLKQSTLVELGLRFDCGDAELLERCRQAVVSLRDQWRGGVTSESRDSVERFYDASETYIFDLMWWHTLTGDDSPLAYVLALDFATKWNRRTCLDFGCGIAAANILFARNGLDITGADISSTLLEFSKWRLELRKLPARLIDTKVQPLRPAAFDMIMAMGTLEHLVDPVETVEALWRSLEPGGILLGCFYAEEEQNHPQHLVVDFGPTLERMESLGFVEVWRDEWLWGYQAFQKGA
jgi:mycofactocin glycosyltransferase